MTEASRAADAADPADGPAAAAPKVPHDLDDLVAGHWRPWPEDHVPATPGERRMWRAFASVRDDEAATLSVRAVARRAGLSPTPIAHEGGAWRTLRAAILAEIERRRPSRPEKPSAEEVAAAKAEHRQTRITYWKAIARQADSLNAEFEARAERAEAKAARTTALMRRVLADIREGRWTRVDPDAAWVADLVAALGPPAERADELDGAEVE